MDRPRPRTVDVGLLRRVPPPTEPPMKKTYEMFPAPPPPMAWEEYVAKASAEWDALKANSTALEAEYQDFLERNPAFVPCSWGEFVEGHHGPFPSALISQPVLSGMHSKRPDFLWITRDSGSIYIVLIEIETPRSRWFAKAGHPHADLTKARNQLTDWRAWFAGEGNTSRFLREYQIPDSWQRHRTVELRLILIHGSRSELQLRTELNQKRPLSAPADERHMTFDRISPDWEKKDCMTVKMRATGYEAIHIAPTLRLGPRTAEDWVLVSGKAEATRRSNDLSPDRVEFLVNRWSYWDRWARLEKKGIQQLETE